METKHTPGPWYQYPQGSEIEIKKGIYTICMVHNYNEPHEQNEANAKLIAAAPEMLEILTTMVTFKTNAFDAHRVYKIYVEKAQAIIKKATI